MHLLDSPFGSFTHVHLNANTQLKKKKRALNGRTIGLIVGDYVRFPPDYLRKCYIPVVKVRRTGSNSTYTPGRTPTLPGGSPTSSYLLIPTLALPIF